jgi:hypothetical protein
MKNPQDFLPKEHWAKPIIKKYNYPFGAVAKFLDLTYPYTSHILSGRIAASPRIEKELARLVEELQKSGRAKK